jgi:sugar lactone lactonase YvrE
MMRGMATTLTTVAEGFAYLECPRWHEGRLWLSDFYTSTVHTVDGSGAVSTAARIDDQPSGLGWLPDGRLLIVSMRDRRVLRREEDGTLAVHADLSDLASWHLNDMLVDDDGRAYVGNFGFDLMSMASLAPAELVVVEPDGAARVEARDLVFPNGMALAPDGRELIVAETLAQRLTAYARHEDGTLGERRTWAEFGPASGADVGAWLGSGPTLAPDGIAAAGDGSIWVADALNHRVVRVAEGGTVLDEIGTGDLGVYACALGGDDGHTLYLCAAPSFAEHERRDTRDGVLLAAQV